MAKNFLDMVSGFYDDEAGGMPPEAAYEMDAEPQELSNAQKIITAREALREQAEIVKARSRKMQEDIANG